MIVDLVCTDLGQHSSRDIVRMINLWRRVPENCTARWYVVWRESWIWPRHKHTPWHPVLPLDSTPGDLHLDRRLREAEVLVFRCPACTRRPRWHRDRLDKLCDGAVAIGKTELDLSLLE